MPLVCSGRSTTCTIQRQTSNLGTTNSAIAIWEPDTGQARVLSNSEGDRLTPSVVMFDTQMNQHIVGKSALDCITSHPSQVIYSVKRFMGCTFRDERVRIDQTQVTYTIAEVQESKVAVCIGKEIFTPPQISAQILRKLKEDAEATLIFVPFQVLNISLSLQRLRLRSN
ncbi:MAG: Hsp70 family protein [Gloeotrichia echinulata HAB0833]